MRRVQQVLFDHLDKILLQRDALPDASKAWVCNGLFHIKENNQQVPQQH
jgi:hypothetical protein